MIALIYHNAGKVDNPDRPEMPYKLTAILRPPEFLKMAFIGIHGGSEKVIIRGDTKEELEEFAKINGINTHARLIRMNVEGPLCPTGRG